MDANKLFELYERLYFHEIEMREKLNGRLQLPLAVLISVIGALAFMLRNFSNSGEKNLLILFLLLYVLSCLFVVIGVHYFIRSWYGYEYSFIPSAVETENYRQTLVETYAEFENSEDLVEMHFANFLRKYYIECSSKNTENNDKRSLFLHFTNRHIVTGAIFAFLSLIPFYFGSFDKNLKESIQVVRVCEPIEIKGVGMSKDEPKNQERTPPPPPPPPPKRVIKEGVEIKHPEKKSE